MATLMLSLLLAGFAAAAQPQFTIVVGLPPARGTKASQAKLDEEFWAIATPRSEKYLRFLSNDQIAGIIGASPGLIDEADASLRSLGAFDVKVSAHNSTLVASFDENRRPLAAGLWTSKGFPKTSSLPETVFVLRRDPGAIVVDGSARTHRRPAYDEKLFGPRATYTIPEQKKEYGIPEDLQATNKDTTQIVWGPGTFGYSKSELAALKAREVPLLNLDKVKFDTENHGEAGGDNFGEGNLDTQMISSFGLNVETIVSNTNTSASTEEGQGFGQAMLDFVTELSQRDTIPQVMSLSLGSLSPKSCDLLCEKAVEMGQNKEKCRAFMQKQRQVCMFLSEDQARSIDRALQVLGTRGMTIFGSSGDGGSHWSFEKFPELTEMGRVLNRVGCKFQFPIYPSPSPYVISVGGTVWQGADNTPVAWSGSGGGFSWEFASPTHQQSLVQAYLKNTDELPPPESFNASGRAYPDVAAVSVEGTSQSSPTTAGIFSLVMDHRLNKGLKPLGFLGPRLWEVASKFPGEAFTDVTEGNSKTSCDNGFPATKGWDPVTGFGQPIFPGLIKHFGSDEGFVN